MSGATRETLLAYAMKKYKTSPERLWAKYPDYQVLRHSDSEKWYGVIMDIPREKLGLAGSGKVDILEIKCAPMLTEALLEQQGVLPAYHMKKGSWLTVLLDGTADLGFACNCLDMSFDMTSAKKQKRTEPKEWLIPANPAYYDVEAAFRKEKIITWKQSGSMIPGDTVFMYVAAPVSAVMYKCRVLETDIPYSYDNGRLTIKKLMKIELLHSFSEGDMTFSQLGEFGVFAVRGPRSVPYGLSCEFSRLERKEQNKGEKI